MVTLMATNNGSARTAPLSNAAVAVLRTALANRARAIDPNLVFFGEPGRDKVRRPCRFRPPWHRTLAALGIQSLRFHDLRHEAVSRLVDQEIAAISRHKSTQMLRRYTLLRDEDLVCRFDQLGVRWPRSGF